MNSPTQQISICSKSTTEVLEKGEKYMFKVNNKGTKPTSSLNIFHIVSSVSIVGSEHLTVCKVKPYEVSCKVFDHISSSPIIDIFVWSWMRSVRKRRGSSRHNTWSYSSLTIN